MIKNVLIDFMGVLGKLDLKELLKDYKFSDKMKLLKVLSRIYKDPICKQAFENYQIGLPTNKFIETISKQNPECSLLIPYALSNIEGNINENIDLFDFIYHLRSQGIKVILLSNTIPQTTNHFKKSRYDIIFDKIYCSDQLGMRKPEPEIFNHVIQDSNIDPKETIYIDDNPANIETGKKLGFETYLFKRTKDCIKSIDNVLYNQYENQL